MCVVRARGLKIGTADSLKYSVLKHTQTYAGVTHFVVSLGRLRGAAAAACEVMHHIFQERWSIYASITLGNNTLRRVRLLRSSKR